MRTPIVVLGIVTVLAAGCGGGSSSSGTTGGPATTAPAKPRLSKAAYEAKLKQISTQIRNSIGRTAATGKIPKADVDKLAKAFHAFADRLAAVNPPAAIKQLHARLIKAMNDLGDEFPSIAKQLNSAGKDPTSAIAAVLGARAIRELAKIGDELTKKGYTLDLNP